jgi:uncharacterized membrane protein YccC
MMGGYVKAMEKRAAQHGERKAQQQAETDAAKKAALDDAARYVAELEECLVLPD